MFWIYAEPYLMDLLKVTSVYFKANNMRCNRAVKVKITFFHLIYYHGILLFLCSITFRNDLRFFLALGCHFIATFASHWTNCTSNCSVQPTHPFVAVVDMKLKAISIILFKHAREEEYFLFENAHFGILGRVHVTL